MDVAAAIVLGFVAVSATWAILFFRVWRDHMDMHRELLRGFLATREHGAAFEPVDRVSSRVSTQASPRAVPPTDYELEEQVG